MLSQYVDWGSAECQFDTLCKLVDHHLTPSVNTWSVCQLILDWHLYCYFVINTWLHLVDCHWYIGICWNGSHLLASSLYPQKIIMFHQFMLSIVKTKPVESSSLLVFLRSVAIPGSGVATFAVSSSGALACPGTFACYQQFVLFYIVCWQLILN